MISQIELGIHQDRGISAHKRSFEPLRPPADTGSLGNGVRAGDLLYQNPDTTLAVLNHAAGLFYEASHASSDISVRVGTLEQKQQQFHDYVHNPDNYPTHAYQQVQECYKAADAITADTMLQRVSNRLAFFSGVEVKTDLDGTLTENPDEYLVHIPGSAVAEPVLAEHGRGKFIDTFVRSWQPLLEHAPFLFQQAGQHAKIRPGVAEFMQNVSDSNIPTTVISANFGEFANAVLDKFIPPGYEVETFTIQPDNLVSLEKGDLIKHAAQTNPDRAVVVIGDGASDIPALEAHEVVACYFALEGSSFAAELETRQLPYFTYKNFYDILDVFTQLNILNTPAPIQQ